MQFGDREVPNNSRDNRENPKFGIIVFIFYRLSFKRYQKIRSTFSLPLFMVYNMMHAYFESDVSSPRYHHQLLFLHVTEGNDTLCMISFPITIITIYHTFYLNEFALN